MQIDLSVIIVNWNTRRLLETCLESIFKFTKVIKFEVIVIDNGSQDKSQELVKNKFPQVKLILNKDNLGFTKANNQGIKIAKGEYVLLLNSDTYLIENSFAKLIKKARELAKSEKLGALGPQLLNEDRTIQQSAGFFPHLPQVFYWMSFIDDLPGGTVLKPYHIDHDSFYQKDRQVDWVTAAAILVPKRVIEKAGGLDETIFMYGEEVDWCYRMKQEKFKIVYSPATKIVHIGRGSSGKISQNAILGEYKGLIYFYKKHKNSLSLQMLRILLKIGALARLLAFPIFGKGKVAKFYAEALKVV
jgi:GT2 family glycosyltransferase